MVVKLIAARKGFILNIDGFLYYFVRESNGRSYWRVKKLEECSARAITSTNGTDIVVHKGPAKSQHI